MKLQAKWMLVAVFCLSALAFSEEADALRVDKVYKVLFVSYQSLPPAPPLAPEVQSIHDALEDALPPANGSEILIRTAQAISEMTFEQLAEYSFVLWHVAGVGAGDPYASDARYKIQAADLPVVILDGAGFPISELFGLVEPDTGGSASGSGNQVQGDTDDAHGKGLYHSVLRNLVIFQEINDYEPPRPGGGATTSGRR